MANYSIVKDLVAGSLLHTEVPAAQRKTGFAAGSFWLRSGFVNGSFWVRFLTMFLVESVTSWLRFSVSFSLDLVGVAGARLKNAVDHSANPTSGPLQPGHEVIELIRRK
jgi:hypothetical protein